MAGPSFPPSLGGGPAIPPGGTDLPAIRSPNSEGWDILVRRIEDQRSELDQKEKEIEGLQDTLATMAHMAEGKDLTIKRLREGLGPDIEYLTFRLERSRLRSNTLRQALVAAGITPPRTPSGPSASPPEPPVTVAVVEGPPGPQVPSPPKAIKRAEPPAPTSAGLPKCCHLTKGRSGSLEGAVSDEEVGTASGA